MNKIRFLFTFLLSSLSFLYTHKTVAQPQESIYHFTLSSINGQPIQLSQYKGKYMLIVNTASKCGLTPQYTQLEELHKRFGDKLAVLGFPANNFLNQEPGTNTEIAEFCKTNYAVSFDMFEKIDVIGKHTHPLYQWLKKASGKSPSWNFAKYLIGPEGNMIGYFGPKTGPLNQAILQHIQ